MSTIIRPVQASSQVNNAAAWISAHPAEAAYLAANSTNRFMSDLKAKLERYGSLSPAQTACITRSIQRENEQKAIVNSQHVGAEGQRLEFDATVNAVHSFLAPSFTPYGGSVTKYIISMVDAEGNVYKWFTQSGWNIAKGEKVRVRGTVKKHGEYNGVAETVLTRCKIQFSEERPSSEQVAA